MINKLNVFFANLDIDFTQPIGGFGCSLKLNPIITDVHRLFDESSIYKNLHSHTLKKQNIKNLMALNSMEFNIFLCVFSDYLGENSENYQFQKEKSKNNKIIKKAITKAKKSNANEYLFLE